MSAKSATEIGAALLKKPTSDECRQLRQECDRRRDEIREQLTAIEPSSRPDLIPDPPAVAEATLRGPAAFVALNRERELLRVELDQCDRLWQLCHRAAEETRAAELRIAIPKAVKRVSGLCEHVRETLSAYEAAVAALQDALHVVGEFESAGVAYPFNDDELAAILELRERVWWPPRLDVPAHVPAIFDEPDTVAGTNVPRIDPGADVVKRYPRSYALLYERVGSHNGGVISTRRPPWADAIRRANLAPITLSGKGNGKGRGEPVFPSVL